MNPTEAVALCRMVQAVCPHQKFDEMTPDTWGLVLAHVRFVDAQEALVAIAQRQPFVAPAEIIAEVKRIRGRRLAAVDTIQPPSGLDELAYRRWLADTRRTIADGAPPPDPASLPARDMRAIEGTFRTVPADNDDAGWTEYQQTRTGDTK